MYRQSEGDPYALMNLTPILTLAAMIDRRRERKASLKRLSPVKDIERQCSIPGSRTSSVWVPRTALFGGGLMAPSRKSGGVSQLGTYNRPAQLKFEAHTMVSA